MASCVKTAQSLAARADADTQVRLTVEQILADIEQRGDLAVRELSNYCTLAVKSALTKVAILT